MNIAVTATGGGVGQSILKALKGSHYNVIALDSEVLAAGLYMVPQHFIIPYANDERYISELVNICEQHKVDLLFPGMDCELEKLADNEYRFSEIGTKVAVSNFMVIDIADDKRLTNIFLKQNGFPYPKIFLDPAEITFPCVCKPRKGGARSKGVVVAHDIFEVPTLDNYIIQEYIEGDEYTCGTLTLDRKYRGCIVMRRILRDGDTYKAFVEHNDAIEDLCRKICEELKPMGAFNIQLRLRDGIPYVFEFNARCSGTTAARALAGFNEPLMIADYLLKGKEPEFDIKPITILRYWNELVI